MRSRGAEAVLVSTEYTSKRIEKGKRSVDAKGRLGRTTQTEEKGLATITQTEGIQRRDSRLMPSS